MKHLDLFIFYYGVSSTFGVATSSGQTVSGFIDNTGIGPN